MWASCYSSSVFPSTRGCIPHPAHRWIQKPEWSNPWSFDECNYFFLLHQLIDEGQSAGHYVQVSLLDLAFSCGRLQIHFPVSAICSSIHNFQALVRTGSTASAKPTCNNKVQTFVKEVAGHWKSLHHLLLLCILNSFPLDHILNSSKVPKKLQLYCKWTVWNQKLLCKICLIAYLQRLLNTFEVCTGLIIHIYSPKSITYQSCYTTWTWYKRKIMKFDSFNQ